MSLVSGPGRGGTSNESAATQPSLAVERHIAYIQSLDQVECLLSMAGGMQHSDNADSAKMNSNTG